MKRRCRLEQSAIKRRRGLAPLELVLALPLMLFVMALMINIGTVGAWKVREQAGVRNASWRTMYLRSGDANPNPPLWPAAAPVNGGAGSDAAQTDQVWNAQPDLLTPAVRGDAVTEPSAGMMIRVNRKLEMKEGVHDGRAPLERQVPLLRGMLPDNGRYRLEISQNVLDGMWQFHHMGYGHNADRRARLLYEIEPDDFPSVSRLKARLDGGAMGALVGFPLRGSLAPLDADPDLYRLSTLPPRGGQTPPPPSYGNAPATNNGWSPDFYPDQYRRIARQRLRDICIADPTILRANPQYAKFLEEIRRLPGGMGRTFISWYQARLDYLRSLQNQNPPVPVSASEMQQLQDDIDLLNRFLAALPPQHR